MEEIAIEKPKKNEVESEVVEKVEVDVGLEEEEQAKELYAEFSAFLEQRDGITPDVGTKQVISTGLDLCYRCFGYHCWSTRKWKNYVGYSNSCSRAKTI